MKRCPECGRDYNDDSLRFCLDDGAELLFGPAVTGEPATAILSSLRVPPSDSSPRVPPSGSSFGVPPSGGPAEDAKTQFFEGRATNEDPQTANRNPQSEPPPEGGTQNRFDKRLVLAPIALAVIVLGGFFGYRYFTSANSNRISSVAVLPFENRSGNTDTDYLSDGLTDSLISRFSQLPNVKISPTSSVMQYKGKAVDVAQVAKALDVDAVLTGRLMQLGDSLDISVQLVDARSGKIVWAEQYDRKMADLLATQREIATTLTQKMQLKLTGDEQGIAKKYTNNSEAYQLYLKGRYHWSRRSKEEILQAIESYKQAIAIDPNFALAYAAIAEAYNSMGKNPSASPKECIPLAKAAATRALEIDPTLAQAHSALADSMAIFDWDWAGSETHFKKAIELDPNISYTHLVYGGSYLVAVDKADQALEESRRALELEPLSLINNSVIVSAYLNARKFEEGLAHARAAFELDANFPLARHWLAMALVANGRYDDAISLTKEGSHDSALGWLSTVALAHAYAKAGKRAEAEAEIAKLRELGKAQYVRTYYLASIYAMLGDKDKAFAELEKSFEDRDCYLGRIASDPFMDPLRDDARFKDLMKRMGLNSSGSI